MSSLSDGWWAATVTEMIASEARAPLWNKIGEYVREERDRMRRDREGTFTFDDIDLNNRRMRGSIFADSDIKEMFGMMQKRLRGEISFEQLAEYQSAIERAVKNKSTACDSCDDGLLFAESMEISTSPFVFLCQCFQGQNRKEDYPRWSERFTKNYKPMYGKKKNAVIVIKNLELQT